MGNPFGNARTIDSTKREREIEEKLRKTDISEDKPRSNQQKSQHTDEKTTTNSNEKSGGDEPKKVRSPPPPKEIEEPPTTESNDISGDKKKVHSPTPPKHVEEDKPPKVAVSNKYAFLPEDDEVGSGKDDSD